MRDAAGPRRTPDARLAEAVGLARAIDLEVVCAEAVRLTRPVPATLLGGGLVDRLKAQCEADEIGLLFVDNPLTPVQQRNLETRVGVKVIDRTGLILEIFGARARTHEGRLQVELAALSFQRSRLVRSWTHLERQRGGLGFVGGPGESQLEIDRRLIDERISRIKRDLEKVVRTRTLHREARERVPYPIIALVGYTNAGKSTLFNRLTEAKVMAKDMLFATLDPTMRRIELPNGTPAILSDTVGFISELPTDLVAAFRATLEEVRSAEVLIHVRDISSDASEIERADVDQVLKSLDIAEETIRIEALNKIDLLDTEARADVKDSTNPSAVADSANQRGMSFALSAETGEGVAPLIAAIEEVLQRGFSTVTFDIAARDGAAVSWLYERGRVEVFETVEDVNRIRVKLSHADLGRFEQRFGIAPTG
ncbi:MAG: GTPase HflX [Alphaproteobacteria bacterium]